MEKQLESLHLDNSDSDVSPGITDFLESENYFKSWLGTHNIDNLPAFIGRLYRHTNKLPLNEDFDDEETENQWHSNWNLASSIEVAIAPLVEAFLCIESGIQENVLAKISLSKKYFEHASKKTEKLLEYSSGFEYLQTRLNIHYKVKFENAKLDSSWKSDLFPYEDLNNKEKSVVCNAKWKLMETFVHRHHDLLNALQEVADLDTENFMWNYLLVMRHRYVRRHTIDTIKKLEPTEGEIRAVIKSVEQSRSHGKECEAHCLGGFCQTLAEILHWRYIKKMPDECLEFGDIKFPTYKDVIDYLKSNARAALDSESVSFGELIRYGEILSSILPYAERDLHLANAFYTAALAKQPENSKANHKMGGLLLAMKDLQGAVSYYREAVKHGPLNFFARMDLINSLLASPKENQKDIEKVFEDFWEQKDWNEKQANSFTFIEGSFFFVINKKFEAFNKWFTITDPALLDFKNLQKVHNRYMWNLNTNGLLEDILDFIVANLRSADIPDKAQLKLLEENVRSAMTGCSRNWEPNYYRHQPRPQYPQEQRNPRRGFGGPRHPRSPSPDNWRS